MLENKSIYLSILKGSDLILIPPAKSKRNVYPKQLEDLGEKHWIENTTIEPALHRRKAELDDKETIPTRYQSLTDKEQYELFKEHCSEEMKEILRKYASDETVKVN